jgi:hypothetical protein
VQYRSESSDNLNDSVRFNVHTAMKMMLVFCAVTLRALVGRYQSFVEILLSLPSADLNYKLIIRLRNLLFVTIFRA